MGSKGKVVEGFWICHCGCNSIFRVLTSPRLKVIKPKNANWDGGLTLASPKDIFLGRIEGRISQRLFVYRKARMED